MVVARRGAVVARLELSPWTTSRITRFISLLLSFPLLGGYLTVLPLATLVTSLVRVFNADCPYSLTIRQAEKYNR